jgi:FHA domain
VTATCPNGHTSSAPDYCDTCGAPIADGATAGAPAGAGPDAAGEPSGGAATASGAAAVPETCPSCGSDRAAAALFCEACGYDFTTGTMPRPPDAPPASALDLDAVGAAAAQPVAPPIPIEWVAEIWVDPDWYASQESEDPCPSPGLPAVVPLSARSVLVGRPSTSRNIHPEVDCTGDPGVSRRQAQLTTDGQRWWIEDLQSSNGTYVGPASGPLPTDPVPPGQRRELSEDDRVYVGAWTRLVVRRATPEER